jgi:hypothetical protein
VARRALSFPLLFVLCCLLAAGHVSAMPSSTAVLSDLTVNEQVDGDAIVFGADLDLGPGARIEGDAVAIGGNVRVGDGAEVTRHVVAVLGGAEVSEQANIGGKVLSFSSPATLLPASSDRGVSLERDIPMRLLTAGGWLLVTTGLAFLFPARMRHAAWAVPVLGFKIPALGMLVGLTVVASLIAMLGLGPALGVPMVAGLMVIFFAAKSVGLTVLGCWLGFVILRRWIHHPLPISLEVFVGVLVLLALRFLPFAGETLWTLTSLVALGASIVVIGVSADMMGGLPTSASR